MELRGYRRANKPQSGLFSRHYIEQRKRFVDLDACKNYNISS